MAEIGGKPGRWTWTSPEPRPAVLDHVHHWLTMPTEAAAGIGAAGGQVIVPPFDVFTSGRMAVFLDTVGAAFSIWEPA